MYMWSQAALNLEFKGFEEGLNDARRQAVDPIAYQINREYRSGVEIAQQLMATLSAARSETLNRPIEPPYMASNPVHI